MEVGTLLLGNDKNNAIANKVFHYFYCLITISFLLANADLLKISVSILLVKTYLQKSHCIMIENISSNKA